MRDKRPVDELSIEELERILAIRKREERQKRLTRMEKAGRIIETAPPNYGDATAPPRQNGTNGSPRPTANVTPKPKAPATLDEIVASIASDPAGRNGKQAALAPKPDVRFDDGELIEDFPVEPKRKQVYSNATRRLANVGLLLLEVAAVVGLVFLGFRLIQGLDVLERETAEAQALAEENRRATIPTIAPTPILQLSDIVLPGGHTPPSADGTGGQFNFDEIPQNLRLMVQDQVLRPPLVRPEPTTETALRIIIPSLNVDHSIVQGADWEALKQGIGQVQNGYTPSDEAGNVALTAHNDIYGEIFRDLDQLQPGDQFQIQTQEQIHLYTVRSQEVVDPTAVHVLQSVGRATATLISCYPYRVNTQRIVVFADRVG